MCKSMSKRKGVEINRFKCHAILVATIVVVYRVYLKLAADDRSSRNVFENKDSRGMKTLSSDFPKKNNKNVKIIFNVSQVLFFFDRSRIRKPTSHSMKY